MIDYRDLGITTAMAVSALPSAFPFQEVQVTRLNLTNEVAIPKNIFKVMLKCIRGGSTSLALLPFSKG